MVDAVDESRYPGDESADPTSHSDPEARTPTRGVHLAVRIVVVIQTPANRANNSSQKRQRQNEPSAATSLGEILEAGVQLGQTVEQEEESNASFDNQTNLSNSSRLPILPI